MRYWFCCAWMYECASIRVWCIPYIIILYFIFFALYVYTTDWTQYILKMYFFNAFKSSISILLNTYETKTWVTLKLHSVVTHTFGMRKKYYFKLHNKPSRRNVKLNWLTELIYFSVTEPSATDASVSVSVTLTTGWRVSSGDLRFKYNST